MNILSNILQQEIIQIVYENTILIGQFETGKISLMRYFWKTIQLVRATIKKL